MGWFLKMRYNANGSKVFDVVVLKSAIFKKIVKSVVLEKRLKAK